jgi:hypothetical protein
MVCAFEWKSPNILRPGTLPANITIITYLKKNLIDFILQQLHNVRKQICFSGFIKYHNPKHSGQYTPGRQGGGGDCLRFLECH